MDKQKGQSWMPMMYVNYFGIIQKLAKEHGYALCVHGSVTRDFDLVAIPFEPVVSPHIDLLNAIKNAIGFEKSSDDVFDKVGYEPHGRMCYTIECGGGGYFDISFTPSMQQAIAFIEDGERKRIEMADLLKEIK